MNSPGIMNNPVSISSTVNALNDPLAGLASAVRIKRLVIQGFKSFPDKATLEFLSPICAVVGPNGCGKSNVFDALRWVLGEQGPSQLRAQSMSDVIFNGSAGRRPIGMAEVTLTVECPSLSLPIGFDEIEVTRRLYRSGESEYILNRTACRLRDITDLFLEAGMGKGAYSLIEQGRVDALLTARPEDRRGLLEQSAGIMKYKVRKKEALSKLAATEQNLERVHDILNEVKSRRVVLARQARKAEKFREISFELQEIKSLILASRYSNLSAQSVEIASRIEQIENESSRVRANHGILCASVQNANLRVDETYNQLKTSREIAGKLEFQIDYLSKRIEDQELRRQELSSESVVVRHEIENLENRNIGFVEQTHQLVESAGVLKEELSLRRKRSDDLSSELQIQSEMSANIRKNVKLLKEQYLAVLEKATQTRNLRAQLEEALRRVFLRSEGLFKELENMRREEHATEEESNRASERVDSLAEQVKTNAAELHESNALHGSKQRELDEITGRCQELDSRLVELKSRLKSLEEFLASGEGLQEGVKAVMLDFRLRPGCNGHIAGLLADLYETDSKYERAIFAALESRIQDVVIRDRDEAVRAIRFLNEEQRGRCTFTPVKPKSSRTGDDSTIQSGMKRLITLIKTEDEYKPLFTNLLSNAYLVETLDRAWDLSESQSLPVTIVTLDGEIIASDGSVTAGFDRASKAGYRARKREVAQLKFEIKNLESRRGNFENDRKTLLDVLCSIEQHNRILENRKAAFNIACAEAVRDRDHITEKLKRSRIRREAIETEQNLVSDEAAELQTRLDVIAGQQDVGESGSEASENLKNAETQLETISKDLERLRQESSENCIGLESVSLRLSANEREKTRLTDEKNRISEMIERFIERGRSLLEALGKVGAEIGKLRAELKSKCDERPLLENRAKTAITRWENEKTAASMLQTDLDSLQPQLKRLDDALAEKRIKRAEVESTIAMLREQTLEDLDQFLARSREIGGELEIESWKLRQNQLEKELSELGDVNLTAVDEHRELVERNQFLDEQMNDLEESIKSLKTTISQINQTSRTRFMDAFESVNRYFAEIFYELFEGGEAALQLQSPDDPLETGVDIICRPPGKRARTIDLLSGGEKALSALALLFASFKYRPSPILFLDEVDASLDDANVVRFSKYLKKLAMGTQVVMVTHNPLSMEIADMLYGVTMAEPGISRLVSAKIAFD